MFRISSRVSLQELTDELGHKDYRRTLKWLKRRRVPCKKEGRGYYVLRWHLDFASFLEIAEDLRKLFPTNWFKIFEASVSDKKMVHAVFAVIPPNVIPERSKGNNNEHKYFK